jgi:ELWxxDGT repeat protein
MAPKLPLGLLKRINRGSLIVFTFSSLFILSITASAQPQPVQLLLENHPTEGTFFSNSFPELDGKKYFYAAYNSSSSIFSTDGTVNGTKELELNTANASLGGISDLIKLGDKIVALNTFFFPSTGDYFIASEPALIDPNTGEIAPLKDINNGNFGFSYASSAYEWNEKVFFLANDGVHGHELWITDGTTDGTKMVTELVEGSEGVSSIRYSTFQNKLIIAINGHQIWKTEGSEETTFLVKDLGIENGWIIADDERDFVELDGKLYFTYFSVTDTKYQVWETDGTTEGTVRPVDDSFYNMRIREIDSEIFIFGYLNDVTIHLLNRYTNELELVKSVESGGVSLTSVFHKFSETIFFCTNNKLWKTDGSEIGTILVKEIPGMTNGIEGLCQLSSGELLFVAESNEFGHELWKTDGTEAGTQVVKDIRPGSLASGPYFYTSMNDLVYFSADDGMHGRELWISDGTEAGTTLLKDINTNLSQLLLGAIASTPGQFILAEDNSEQALPNIYVKNVLDRLETIGNPSGNPTFSKYEDLITLNDKIYTLTSEWNEGQAQFTGLVEISNNEISIIKEVYAGSNLTVVGEKLVFTADPPESESREIWISDGTPEGTYEITDIAPGTSDAFGSGNDHGFVPALFNDKMYFSANDQIHGFELWVSDFTTEGTELIKDISSGLTGSNPRSLKTFGLKLFFLAENESDHSAIWFSDGTETGTLQLIELDRKADFVEYHATTDKLFFSIAFNDNSYELYMTSGTEETTQYLSDAGTYHNNFWGPFAGFGDQVLFMRKDGSGNHYDVYSVNGTSVNLYSGVEDLDGAFAIDGLLYMGVGGNYLYRSDGSASSFDRIYDWYNDGGGLYVARRLFPNGKDLVFQAYKNTVRTPWRLPILYSAAEITHNGSVQSSNFEIDFAEKTYSGISERKVVTINNTGYVPLKFVGGMQFELSGTDPKDFELDLSLISDKINPDDSGEIGIAFTPKGIGPRSATLLILTNDEENPLIEIALTGTGTKADPTISFAELPTKSILDEPFDLTASVDTDQEISFSSSNPEIASIEGNTVTIHKAGTVTITASVVETELYKAASKQQSLTINGVEQTITFEALPEKTYGDAPFELSATASSGLDVTFSSSDVAVASVEGVTVTILKAGAVTITALQAGNENYSSATASQDLTINKAAQTITFEALPAKTFGDEPFVLAASTTSGLAAAYASSDATVAKVDGTTVTLLKPGSAAITASQTGNENYLSAASVEQSLAVNKAGQTIIFEPLAAKTYGDPAFELSASSSIGLPVAFSSSNPAVVSVEGNSASIVKAGAVTIIASQAGNDNYNTASAEQTLTVAKAPQTITFDDLPTVQSDDDPIELVAEATSGLPVAFQSLDKTIATMEGATLTITGSGITSITATQGGDENYLAAEDVVRTLVVEEVTGLNELAAQIKVYPNPTESFISIELPGSITQVSYALTLTTGQKVKEGRLTSQQGKVEIPFDGMWAGTYLLTLTNGELSSTWRIIKN